MIKTTSLAIALSLALGGCSNEKITDQNDEDIPVMGEENKAGNKSNERMLNLLSLEQNKELTLQGTEEIEYRLELNHIENIDDITFVSYKGMIDETNLRCIGTFGFYIDYLVTKDEIYQMIKDTNTLNQKHSSVLTSIIPHQIVLKAPLEINHSWEQEFLYNPNEFNHFEEPHEPEYLIAVHKITDIDTNGGKPIFTVETVVKGVKGFPDETYKEVKKWEEGKGLIFYATV